MNNRSMSTVHRLCTPLVMTFVAVALMLASMHVLSHVTCSINASNGTINIGTSPPKAFSDRFNDGNRRMAPKPPHAPIIKG